jgi:hypothetical protein
MYTLLVYDMYSLQIHLTWHDGVQGTPKDRSASRNTCTPYLAQAGGYGVGQLYTALVVSAAGEAH